jgi:predicted deacylase
MENWTIFGETLAPGEARRTVLRIPMGDLPNRGALLPTEAKSGDYEMPMFLLNGAGEGKTALISASIHSGEYAGVPAVIRAGRELEAKKLCGRLILLPCVNTSGFWAMTPALVPENGSNLNRTYPGDAEGGVGERIKAFFVRELFPQLDFMFDLHGGSVTEKMTPLIFFPRAEKVTKASLAAARATNVGCLVASDADNGQYSYAANFMDIPGMLLERGGGFYCDKEWQEADYKDIRLLLDHLGMYASEPGARDESLKRRVFGDTVYLDFDEDGLWYPAAAVGAEVKNGQLLGTLRDFYGETVKEYFAEADGCIFYQWEGLAARKGDFLIAYGLLASETE